MADSDVIIEKHYLGFMNRSVVDHFLDLLHASENGEGLLPVIHGGKYYIAHVRHNDLFFVAPIQGDVSPLLVIEFLHRVAEVFKDYFRDVTEDHLKDNFVTVYSVRTCFLRTKARVCLKYTLFGERCL